MSINQKEKKIIDSLCEAVSIDNKMDKVFKFKWKYGTEIYAEYVTTDLDDNGLELEDPNYEDFICFIMKIEKIMYKCLPHSLFMPLFFMAHSSFYQNANKASKKNKIHGKM